MPWSEWITGPQRRSQAWLRFETTYSEYAGSIGGATYQADQLAETGTVGLAAGFIYPHPANRQHIQLLAAPADADPDFALVETPPGFSTIAGDYGEGWIERPNYVEGDPSTRVEYEPGFVAEVGGWEWSGRPFVNTRFGPSMAATIEYIVPSTYFVGDGSAPFDLTDYPEPLPSGDVVLTVPGDQFDGFLSPTPLPDVGAVPGFAVTINVDDVPDDGEPFTSEPYVQVVLGTPYILVAYPRWRYWMPGPGPVLRQVHRDDGYGITPARARGTSSRQATNRARAYD